MNRRRHIRLSLDLLRGFRAAAQHLSFTRAAQELSVTQSAVSREIRTLEDQIGQPLFHRVSRALQLTRAGEELFRAADEALALVDAAAQRIAGPGRSLGVTTTSALASLWLVPRLPRFTRLHPGIDVRIAASNEILDLEREQLDIAIRFLLPGADMAGGEHLADYRIFPVCAPALARNRSRPLRTPADLARHVLLDYETVLYGRRWYDWERWFGAMKLRRTRTAGLMRFSHYDQVVQAALEGSGVAIGKTPHLTQLLRQGRLVAPFGSEWIAELGSFCLVLARGCASRSDVDDFAAWLRKEAARDQHPPVPAFAGTRPAPRKGSARR
jgi:DNA-binding transcriptional LysR family regulator